MFHLEFPNITHRSRYLDTIAEWKNHETPTSPGALFHGDSFEEFLDITRLYVAANPNGINSTLYFFMDDAEILGAIQVRHHIDHPKLSLEGEAGGHIGYGLRPSARGKGLAEDMLRLGLIEAKKLGIERILISAHADNPASWKTIKRCGGIFLKSIDDEGKKLKVYWIHLDDTTSTTHVFPSPEIITKKKPSRNEIKAKIQYEKAQIRIAKKASIRKKSEKKLVEKSKRKEAHKKANSQKKFKAKIQKNTASQF